MQKLQDLTIRPSQASDAEAIARLFQHVAGKQAIWKWQYHDNPTKGALEAGVVACEQGQVIAFNGAMPVRMRHRGQDVTGYWSLDAMTHPDYRGKGIGTSLKSYLEERCPILMAWGSSPGSMAVHRKRGWERSTRVSDHSFRMRADSLRSAVVVILQRLRRRAPRLPTGWVAESVPIRTVVADGGRLWEQESTGYANAAHRSQEYLTWKYANHPCAVYDAIRIRNPAGLLRAIGIIRICENTSRLVDYVGPRRATAEKNLIIGELVSRRFGTRRIQCITTDDEFAESFEAYGFRAFANSHNFSMLRHPAGDLHAEDWFMMTGDSDGDLLDAVSG